MNFQTFKHELIKNLKADQVPTNAFEACTNILQLMRVTEIFEEDYEPEEDYNNPLQALNLTVEKMLEQENGLETYKLLFLKELLIHVTERPPHWNVDLETFEVLTTTIEESVEYGDIQEAFENIEMIDEVYDEVMYRTIPKYLKD